MLPGPSACLACPPGLAPHACPQRHRPAGKRAPVYVKGLVLGGQLLVHWVEGDSPTSEPRTLELDAAAFTTDEPAAPACYQHTTELVAKLRCAAAAWRQGGACSELEHRAPRLV